MAKALKIAGAVAVGVALAATGIGAVAMGGLAGSLSVAGVSTGTLLFAGTSLQALGTALQKKPTTSSAQEDRLTASIDPRAYRKSPYGRTALPVDVRYEEWFGDDQEYCAWIVCHGARAIESVEEIWINSKLAWSLTGGVTSDFQNFFYVQRIVLEGSPDNIAVISGANTWNGAHRLTGCAYTHVQFRVTAYGKTDSPFTGGPPSQIRFIGKGAKLYDPRRDSTVAGGDGPMRIDDQTTWRYTADDGVEIGRNLALHALDRLIGWRIQNPSTGAWKLSTGSGIPRKRIDLESWISSANLCDEQVAVSAGGTEPRYHGGGVASEGDLPKTTLDAICAACCGRFRDTGGKLSFWISHNDLAAAATDPGLTDDDVMGAFTWDPDPALDDEPNVARGQYTDPSEASLYQLIDYPERTIAGVDNLGIERVLSLTVDYAETASHAQRVVSQALERKQYGRQFSAPFDITAWRYKVGDLVPFTFAPLGFDRKLFRVSEMDPNSNPCPVVLTEESEAIYAWDASDAPAVQVAAVNSYNAAKSGVIQAIRTASTTANWSGVVDDDGNKPEDNATVGAPTGTTVHDRVAEAVVESLDVNTNSILEQALRQDDLLQVFDARTLVEGQPVGTTFLEFREAQEAENAASAATIALIGAKTADGTGFALNLDNVKISDAQSLGQRLNEISVASATATADIAELHEVLVEPGSTTARALLTLNVNGYISGTVATNNGTTSSFSIVADEFAIVDPNGGTPTTPFRITNGVVYMPSVVVDTLAVNAAVVPVTVSATAAIAGSGAGSYSTVFSVTLKLAKAGVVEVIAAANQGFSSVPLAWGFRLLINGTSVWEPSGTYPGDSVPIMGSLACAAGTVTVTLQWAAAAGVTLRSRFLAAKGLNNTQ